MNKVYKCYMLSLLFFQLKCGDTFPTVIFRYNMCILTCSYCHFKSSEEKSYVTI